MAAHPSLDDLRAALGLYQLSKEAAAAGANDALPLVAKWPCGCSARGADMRAMEHVNCRSHERITARPAFAGTRRKTDAQRS